MKLKRWTWLILSGGLWGGIGGWLLSLGAKRMLLALALKEIGATPVLDYFSQIAQGRARAGSLLILGSLAVGWLKGRVVLSKTVARTSRKIETLPEPIALKAVYGWGYLFLVGGMMMLGMILKRLHLPLEVQAMIDVAIGMALMTGAWLYFSQLKKIRVT